MSPAAAGSAHERSRSRQARTTWPRLPRARRTPCSRTSPIPPRSCARSSMREVELKSVVTDPDAVIAAIRASGGAPVFDGRLSDTRYDTADRALLARDHVLRLRELSGGAGSHASIDWKGPTQY